MWAYDVILLYKLPRGRLLWSVISEMNTGNMPTRYGSIFKWVPSPDHRYAGSKTGKEQKEGGWCVRPTPRRQEAGA